MNKDSRNFQPGSCLKNSKVKFIRWLTFFLLGTPCCSKIQVFLASSQSPSKPATMRRPMFCVTSVWSSLKQGVMLRNSTVTRRKVVIYTGGEWYFTMWIVKYHSPLSHRSGRTVLHNVRLFVCKFPLLFSWEWLKYNLVMVIGIAHPLSLSFPTHYSITPLPLLSSSLKSYPNILYC